MAFCHVIGWWGVIDKLTYLIAILIALIYKVP